MTAFINVIAPFGAEYMVEDPLLPKGTLGPPYSYLSQVGDPIPDGTSPATLFTAEAPEDRVFTFTGRGFRYDPSTGDLIAGSITSFTLVVGGATILQATFSPPLNGKNFWTAVTGSGEIEFEDILGNLAHVMTGNSGADRLIGQDANDIIEGMGGGDILDGGDGIDTLTYARASSGVTINMETGVGSAGDADGDQVTNFENLIGSNHDDFLTGDHDANVITGGLGNDTVNGLDGNDVLDGGAGIDTVSYLGVSDGVVVNLARKNPQQTFGGDIDTLKNFENLTGSDHDDVLLGDKNVNVIHGEGEDDIIEGGKGADFLFGDANGSDGDTVSYEHSSMGVIVDLNIQDGSTAQALTNGVKINGDASGDVLSGFENVTGSRRADVLIGDGGDNTLTGAMGKDTLTGGAGEDTFYFAKLTDKGDLITDFVSGEDTLEFAAAGFKGTIIGDVNFASGTGAGLVAAAKEATFLYDTANGNLYFDADGTGAGAKQLVVTLDGAPALQQLDILIV